MSSTHSGEATAVTPDEYIAALFASMHPGARVVTFYPLPLGPTRSQANHIRHKHGLSMSDDASFFEARAVNLDSSSHHCCDSSSYRTYRSLPTKRNVVYLYTRVPQSSFPSVFQCSNPYCQDAQNGTLIPATVNLRHTNHTVLNYCKCKNEPRSLQSLWFETQKKMMLDR